MSVHNEEKCKECNYCGKKFPNMSALLKHMLSHSGYFVYYLIFYYCGKKLPNMSALLKHMLSHSSYFNYYLYIYTYIYLINPVKIPYFVSIINRFAILFRLFFVLSYFYYCCKNVLICQYLMPICCHISVCFY